MKKSTIIVLICLGIAIAIGAVFYISYFTKAKSGTTPVFSLLTVVNNDVQTKSPTDADFATVANNQQVGDQWKIKTSLTGRAIIEGAGSVTTIDKNSEVTINHQSQNNTSLQLGIGTLWAKVAKVLGVGEGYEVQTQNAVAAVRGTAFTITYASHITTVIVDESVVAVISKDPATGQQIGEEKLAHAGQKATVIDGKEPVIEDIKNVNGSSGSNLGVPKTTNPASQPTNPATSSTGGQLSTGGQTPTPTRSTTTPSTNPTSVPGGGGSTSSGSGGVSSSSPTATLPSPTGPTIKSASPSSITMNELSRNTIIAITGDGLDKAQRVLFNSQAMSFAIVDAQNIKVNPVNQLGPGTYDISIMLSDGQNITLPQAFVIR